MVLVLSDNPIIRLRIIRQRTDFDISQVSHAAPRIIRQRTDFDISQVSHAAPLFPSDKQFGRWEK